MHREYVERLLITVQFARDCDDMVRLWLDSYEENRIKEIEVLDSVSDISKDMLDIGDKTPEINKRLQDAHDKIISIAEDRAYLSEMLKRHLGMSHLSLEDFEYIMRVASKIKTI